MSDLPKGGQAFPGMSAHGHKDYEPGLSARDWFAGQAIASRAMGSGNPSTIARLAYELADAMLAERDRK